MNPQTVLPQAPRSIDEEQFRQGDYWAHWCMGVLGTLIAFLVYILH